MLWTAKQVQVLRDGWFAGLSSGQIAKQVGVTRAAVARKRAWLGLPARIGAVRLAAERANGRRSGSGLRLLPDYRSQGPPKAPLPTPERMGPLRGSEPRPWLSRGAGECCFPVVGVGADTLSCCEPVELGRPYCVRHRKIVIDAKATCRQQAHALSP